MFKRYIRRKLEGYARRYFKAHPEVKLVAVTGSIGKTSTKMAIATVLGERYRVRFHEGNYNSELSTPLAIFGLNYPENLRSISQWREKFKQIRSLVKAKADVDVIVQEFGTDRIGHVAEFGRYLRPDIGVVTAVAPEHMEFFKTLDNVAIEELGLAEFSKQTLINREDIDQKYAKYIKNKSINTYGSALPAEYRYESNSYSLEGGHRGIFVAPEFDKPTQASLHLIGDHSLRSAAAAVGVAAKLGLNSAEIAAGLAKIKPVSGRMNILKGKNQSLIIDDTYNSSPVAAANALRILYQIQSPQRIAMLGDMNELGDMSADAHSQIGKLCTPAELALVVTVGEMSEKYLAPAAKSNGCKVRSFKTSVEAGEFVKTIIEPGAAILAKGSQGGIYMEEAIKPILDLAEDAKNLVRQTPKWVRAKAKFLLGKNN